MGLSAIWSTLKVILVCAAVGVIVWFVQDYRFQLFEAKRNAENLRQQYTADTTGMSTLRLRNNELEDYLKYKDPELLKTLEKSNVRLSRIESIVSTTLAYRDTVSRSYDFSGLVKAIKASTPASQSFVDSTGCMIITGKMSAEGDSLKMRITDRQFKNKSDGVVYWQRRQWKFLGIKTRILGKKEYTSKAFDECGESKILRIEKQK